MIQCVRYRTTLYLISYDMILYLGSSRGQSPGSSFMSVMHQTLGDKCGLQEGQINPTEVNVPNPALCPFVG